MKNRLDLKIIFIITIAFLLYSLFFYFNTLSKDRQIDVELNKEIDNLKIHYDITKDYFIKDVKNISNKFLKDKDISNILSKMKKADKKQKDILRKELYDTVNPTYKRLKNRGINQVHFASIDNISLLRMHKPNIFGDDLTNTRYSFKYTNKTKKHIEGFEQGKSTHAFRYTFPYFDDKQNYLGAVDISLSTYIIQKRLQKINKIHSHFLIKKELFLNKIWKNKDITSLYAQSIESDKYISSLTIQHNPNQLEYEKNKIIKPLKNKIDKNLSLEKPFSLYIFVDNKVKIITFLPIENILGDKNAAYIVSYTQSSDIYTIQNNYIKINIITLIIIITILLFIIKILKQKDALKIKTKEQESLLSLFEESDSVLFKWNNDNKWSISYVSKSVKKLLGYEAEDFLSKELTYNKIIHKDDLDRVKKEVQKGIESNLNFFQHEPYRVITKTNKTKWVKDYTVKIKDDNNIIHFLGYTIDITEDKRKSDILMQQAKLAAMGEMIGNIAHQWRQPINNLSLLNISLKQKYISGKIDDEFINKFEEKSNKMIQKMSSTIDDFRNFFLPNRSKENFRVQDAIKNTLSIAEASLSNNYITLTQKYSENTKITTYKNELEQVILNIISNSKDALVKQKELKDKKIDIYSYENEKYIIIEQVDNGGGIDKDILPKIFEPYFTTKFQDNGTGIGLYMSKTIVEQHIQGSIDIKNFEDGVKVIIKIPKGDI